MSALAWLRRDLNALHLAGAAALAAYALFVADGYGQRLMTTAGCYAFMVLGYQFMFGHAGALSLAQGAFFGLGAYVTGLLALKLGWGFLATFPAAVLFTALLAAVIALPVLRLESHYFALATLGIGQVVFLVAAEWTSFTGGRNGLYGVPGIEVFGWTVEDGAARLIFVWLLVAAAGCLALWLVRGRFGRALRLFRDSRFAAEASGINGPGLRFAAFVLSAGFGAAGGALFIHGVGVLSPEVLRFDVMVLCLTMTVIGGRTRIAGAVLGAILLTHLPEWFRFLERDYLLAYGIIMLAVIVLAPEGVMGSLGRLRARLGASAPEPMPAEIGAAPPEFRKIGVPLRATALTKRFGGNTALAYAGLEARGGEILGIIGPNGSGKTTLLNLLAGQYRPDAGRVTLCGADVTRRPAWRRTRAGLARSFQSPALAPGRSVLETLHLALPKGREADAWPLLERTGLLASAGRPAESLGSAEARRLEIARALTRDPAVLLLDEPAAGLTPDERAELSALLRDLAGEGRAIVVVEHTMAFLLPLADRLMCLDAGMVIAAGAPAEVARDPGVIEAYLGGEMRLEEPA